MKKYNEFVATDNIYSHISRGGAGTASSQNVLTTTQDTYDPVDGSFVYAIVPGADGVKFSVMEEDGVRCSDERIGYTYKPNQTITGRFSRLIRETGDCIILLATPYDYTYLQPRLLNINALDFEATRFSQFSVGVFVPETYKLFKGKDLGLLVTIEKENIAEADVVFGTLKIIKGEVDVLEINSYFQSATGGIAKYLIAASDTDLDLGEIIEAIVDDEGDGFVLPLKLNEEGEHKINVQLIEMVITSAEPTDILETAGRVLSERSVDVVVTEFIPSIEADMLTFSLAEQTGAAVIGDGTIDIEVANGTVVTALVATFTNSDAVSSVKVGITDQVSATTANDFTEAVTYVVTAEDTETTKDWVVTVTVAEAE